ncbi:hypothetical protein [Stenomitos frigidus]|uniref:Uncharacterized protein n=1 Tax=Stenomitos frigidus ULC18 TaxID=2107698 RepID=A0A2T1EI71_9CYAN|nr:hypothetical protein [Stenomitos frigidus]PSB32462.1 hypothetical protein C7B82_05580 [Stenomitos frigidus ULC18]
MNKQAPRYNIALRLTGWLLKSIYLLLLVLLPLHLVLLTFNVTLPMEWLLPYLGRTLLLAVSSFLFGGFWAALSR